MRQADQTVLSLRPGGGGGNRGRVIGPRFDSSSFGSSDLPAFRPHGGVGAPLAFKTGDTQFESRERVRYNRDQLLQLREVVTVPEEILLQVGWSVHNLLQQLDGSHAP